MSLLQSPQFVTANGRRLVVLEGADWEALVEWIEDLEDREIVKESLEELRASGGDRKKAGWLNWRDLKASDNA